MTNHQRISLLEVQLLASPYLGQAECAKVMEMAAIARQAEAAAFIPNRAPNRPRRLLIERQYEQHKQYGDGDTAA